MITIANGNTYVLIDDVWHYVTLDDILSDYLAVIEGDSHRHECLQGGSH